MAVSDAEKKEGVRTCLLVMPLHFTVSKEHVETNAIMLQLLVWLGILKHNFLIEI